MRRTSLGLRLSSMVPLCAVDGQTTTHNGEIGCLPCTCSEGSGSDLTPRPLPLVDVPTRDSLQGKDARYTPDVLTHGGHVRAIGQWQVRLVVEEQLNELRRDRIPLRTPERAFQLGVRLIVDGIAEATNVTRVPPVGLAVGGVGEKEPEAVVAQVPAVEMDALHLRPDLRLVGGPRNDDIGRLYARLLPGVRDGQHVLNVGVDVTNDASPPVRRADHLRFDRLRLTHGSDQPPRKVGAPAARHSCSSAGPAAAPTDVPGARGTAALSSEDARGRQELRHAWLCRADA